MWPFGWRKRIEKKLDRVISLLERLENQENNMSQALDDLAAQVAANTQVEQSAITLINGIAAQLAAAGTDPAKLTELHDQLKASADALAAAVIANTRAVPVGTPTPSDPPPADPTPTA